MMDDITGAGLTSRVLSREDLPLFLRGQLLGFALDDYFDGAYMGAFGPDGRPAGFIFTGHESDEDEVLIGVPHVSPEWSGPPELVQSFLLDTVVRKLLDPEDRRCSRAVAAVYSDQEEGERRRLEEAYGTLGFEFYRDSQIYARSLTDDLREPGRSLTYRSVDDVGDAEFAALCKSTATGSDFEGTDFEALVARYRRGARFDPELFSVAYTTDGEEGGETRPVGVFMARLDLLVPSEAAFYYIGVMPGLRSGGYGSDLLLKCLGLLRERGATKTREIVPSTSGGAIALLRKHGYELLEWARYFVRY
ncbi:GNAT family N-acetyltransferase [Candidatus Fermentibacterales bacterium]|nr:GNAT family N-acetyltransferase [Candidatus Fermentibacterales bacterium]